MAASDQKFLVADDDHVDLAPGMDKDQPSSKRRKIGAAGTAAPSGGKMKNKKSKNSTAREQPRNEAEEAELQSFHNILEQLVAEEQQGKNGVNISTTSVTPTSPEKELQGPTAMVLQSESNHHASSTTSSGLIPADPILAIQKILGAPGVELPNKTNSDDEDDAEEQANKLEAEFAALSAELQSLNGGGSSSSSSSSSIAGSNQSGRKAGKNIKNNKTTGTTTKVAAKTKTTGKMKKNSQERGEDGAGLKGKAAVVWEEPRKMSNVLLDEPADSNAPAALDHLNMDVFATTALQSGEERGLLVSERISDDPVALEVEAHQAGEFISASTTRTSSTGQLVLSASRGVAPPPAGVIPGSKVDPPGGKEENAIVHLAGTTTTKEQRLIEDEFLRDVAKVQMGMVQTNNLDPPPPIPSPHAVNHLVQQTHQQGGGLSALQNDGSSPLLPLQNLLFPPAPSGASTSRPPLVQAEQVFALSNPEQQQYLRKEATKIILQEKIAQKQEQNKPQVFHSVQEFQNFCAKEWAREIKRTEVKSKEQETMEQLESGGGQQSSNSSNGKNSKSRGSKNQQKNKIVSILQLKQTNPKEYYKKKVKFAEYLFEKAKKKCWFSKSCPVEVYSAKFNGEGLVKNTSGSCTGTEDAERAKNEKAPTDSGTAAALAKNNRLLKAGGMKNTKTSSSEGPGRTLAVNENQNSSRKPLLAGDNKTTEGGEDELESILSKKKGNKSSSDKFLKFFKNYSADDDNSSPTDKLRYLTEAPPAPAAGERRPVLENARPDKDYFKIVDTTTSEMKHGETVVPARGCTSTVGHPNSSVRKSSAKHHGKKHFSAGKTVSSRKSCKIDLDEVNPEFHPGQELIENPVFSSRKDHKKTTLSLLDGGRREGTNKAVFDCTSTVQHPEVVLGEAASKPALAEVVPEGNGETALVLKEGGDTSSKNNSMDNHDDDDDDEHLDRDCFYGVSREVLLEMIENLVLTSLKRLHEGVLPWVSLLNANCPATSSTTAGEVQELAPNFDHGAASQIMAANDHSENYSQKQSAATSHTSSSAFNSQTQNKFQSDATNGAENKSGNKQGTIGGEHADIIVESWLEHLSAKVSPVTQDSQESSDGINSAQQEEQLQGGGAGRKNKHKQDNNDDVPIWLKHAVYENENLTHAVGPTAKDKESGSKKASPATVASSEKVGAAVPEHHAESSLQEDNMLVLFEGNTDEAKGVLNQDQEQDKKTGGAPAQDRKVDEQETFLLDPPTAAHYSSSQLQGIGKESCNPKPTVIQIKQSNLSPSLLRMARIFAVLNLIHEMLVQNRVCTQRELFYRLKSKDLKTGLFTQQLQLNKTLEEIVLLLRTPRKLFGVLTVNKGLISGPFLTIGGRVLPDTTTRGVPISEDIVDKCARDIDLNGKSALLNAGLSSSSYVKCILIVEKETVFFSLLDHFNKKAQEQIQANNQEKHGKISKPSNSKTANYKQVENIVLVTAKGFPDVLTRKLLTKLAKLYPLTPFLYLGDCDPHGVHIFLKYKQTLPNLRSIGLHVTDVIADVSRRYPSVGSFTAKEKRMLLSLKEENYLVLSNPALRMEIERMLQCGYKYEVEALLAYSGGSSSISGSSSSSGQNQNHQNYGDDSMLVLAEDGGGGGDHDVGGAGGGVSSGTVEDSDEKNYFLETYVPWKINNRHAWI
ncbi:unnamed protein product [Amoebophrya sp. A120]|nr:unnamed protein product [Amoebophrya sp. A120]|eukprot:GSA120T00013268001.1